MSTTESSVSADVPLRLISAIYAEDLCEQSRRLGDMPPAPQALDACLAIGARVAAQTDELVAALRAEGVEPRLMGSDPKKGRQAHRIGLMVDSAAQAKLAAQILRGHDFQSKLAGGEAAWEAHRRLADRVTLRRTGSRHFVVDLGWPTPTSWLGRLPRVFRPTVNDYDLRDLPRSLWPLYLVLRPFRLAAERMGLRARAAERAGPFVSTPTSLIDQLLDFGGVTQTDLVLDVGCGDGRLVIRAVQLRGCRARGVDKNPAQVRRARAEVLERDLTDHIDIVEGEGALHPLEDVTVIFLVVPGRLGIDLVERVLARMPSGATLVVHSQAEMAFATAPDMSAPLFGADAVTVAHRWSKP